MRRQVVALALVASLLAACGGPLHPSDDGGAAAARSAAPRTAAASPHADPSGGSRESPAPGDPGSTGMPPTSVGTGPEGLRSTTSARIGDLAVVERAEPVSIRLPSIEVEAPVTPTGAENGAFDVIEGVAEVGWYRYGPSPGQPGSAVLAAHVDTARDGPGLFFDLDRLRPGDTVEVALSDGSREAFLVVSTDRYDKDELPASELFSREGAPQLALITCGGAFDPELRRYQDNVVVVAEPVDSGR